MNNNFNKKKFILIPSVKRIKQLIIILTLILFLFLIYEELYFKKRYKGLLQEFSVKYNYLLESYETNSVRRVEKLEKNKIINKHLGKSIFLIPLSDISYKIKNLKWVKDVNLSTNLKNKIKIEILEYEPVGLYFFNVRGINLEPNDPVPPVIKILEFFFNLLPLFESFFSYYT